MLETAWYRRVWDLRVQISNWGLEKEKVRQCFCETGYWRGRVNSDCPRLPSGPAEGQLSSVLHASSHLEKTPLVYVSDCYRIWMTGWLLQSSLEKQLGLMVLAVPTQEPGSAMSLGFQESSLLLHSLSVTPGPPPNSILSPPHPPLT